MTARKNAQIRKPCLVLAAMAMCLGAMPVAAQTGAQTQNPTPQYAPPPSTGQQGHDYPADPTANPRYTNYAANGGGYGQPAPRQAPAGQTYHQDDLIGAAEGVFGKGAHGLAGLVHAVERVDVGRDADKVARRLAAENAHRLLLLLRDDQVGQAGRGRLRNGVV